MSFAAVHIPEFPIAAWQRSAPELRSQSCAVLEGVPPQEKVVSVCERGRATGIEHGMCKVQAEAGCAGTFRSRQIEEERAAFVLAVEIADRFSPRVEAIASPSNAYAGAHRPAAVLLIDSSGTSKLFGSAESYARKLYREFRTAGFPAGIGMAPNGEAARMLAQSTSQVVCADRDSVRDKLSKQPVSLLPCEAKTLTVLFRWGIRTLGELAALPETALVSRLGQEGRRLQLLARGEADHLLVPQEPEFTLSETTALDSPLELLDSLLFVLSPMLEIVLQKAIGSAYALRSVRLTLQLERGDPHFIKVRPATPTQNREVLLKLLNLELHAHPPQSGIVGITLDAEPTQPQTAQGGLFQAQFPGPDQLELLLARLRSIAGDQNVGSPQLQNSSAEDAFTIVPFQPSLRTETTSDATPSRLAIRMFRPPHSAHVTCCGNQPVTLLWQGARLAVTAAAGPWHSSGSWWDGHAWDHDLWDVVTADPVQALRLRQEIPLKAGSWRGSMTEGYVELHARSAFSFLEGASLPEAMTQQAANLELPGLAILDRDGLYGSPRLYTTAKKLGLRSHIGAEVSVDAFGQQVQPPAWQPHTIPSRPVRLSLLCESPTGYRNLSMLITGYKLAQQSKGDGIASFREIERHAEGLVCMTGGDEGPLAAALERDGMEGGRKILTRLVQTFGPKNVYVELQRHGVCEQEARNQAAISLAREFQLPLLATNGVNMATEFEREILDVLTSIRHRCSLDDAGLLLQKNGKRHLRSSNEMCTLFRDVAGAIAATAELSDRLSFQMKEMGYEFPRYPIPEGETMDSFLRKRTFEGVARRYGAKASAKLRSRADKQVEKELALISKLGLAGYFLIVWDIVEFCRRNGILVQGRGSAANSAVCYSLGITAVDPVRMELLFERFLSEVRGEWPDIDLDLPSGDDRERAIQYVYDRYGQLGAAMCANVITYRGRSAAREVGKSLGFDADMQTRLTRLVGAFEWKGPNDTMEHHFRQAGFDLHHPRIAKYLELSIRMLDLPRHLGQHSGGMIIAQGQLASVVPIEPASMPGRNVVQWDKEDCADMGLIKVDLLGLGMMAVLKDWVELIPRHYDRKVDIAQIPHDDAKVYESLRRADTIGLFQVESRAQMASLPRNNPDKFYDLVVQVAIIRPGPIVGQMMNPYMERRQGRQEIRYPHPLLEPVLRRTLGVPLFQEQLLRIAMVIANFTGGEAEELRRALGSRRSAEKMRALEVKLRAGMDANAVGPKAQEEIILAISSFALYGFPESHAASFALIAYASAWLKFHYLPVFTAAILNNQPMGFYSAAVLLKDAQRHGLRIKPVDILRSDWNCILEREQDESLSLRLGLRYVRGLRSSVAAEIERVRASRPFVSIEELARRVPSLSQADLSTLAETGALNSLGEKVHRRDALWQVERAGRKAGPLLSELDDDEQETSPLPPMNPEERMVADYAGTGVTVGRHSMAHCRVRLRSLNVFRAGDLKLVRHGVKARIAGQVIARQRPGTAHGFIFLSLEDETGIANAIIDPDLYEANRSLVTYAKFLLIEGALQNVDNVIHIRAKHIEELDITAAPMVSHDFY